MKIAVKNAKENSKRILCEMQNEVTLNYCQTKWERKEEEEQADQSRAWWRRRKKKRNSDEELLFHVAKNIQHEMSTSKK